MPIILCIVGKRIGRTLLEAAITEVAPDDQVHVVASPLGREANVLRDVHDLHHDCFIHHSFDDVMDSISSRDFKADWLLNLWGEAIIAEDVLAAVGDSVNVHPGFLPFGRGSDPVLWSQLRGWPLGASLHRMSPIVDRGAIWARRRVEIRPLTAGRDAYSAVLMACIDLFADTWPHIRNGKIHPVQQGNPELPTQRRSQLWSERTKTLTELGRMTEQEIATWAAAFDYGPSFRASVIISPGFHLAVSLDGRI